MITRRYPGCMKTQLLAALVLLLSGQGNVVDGVYAGRGRYVSSVGACKRADRQLELHFRGGRLVPVNDEQCSTTTKAGRVYATCTGAHGWFMHVDVAQTPGGLAGTVTSRKTTAAAGACAEVVLAWSATAK